MQQSKIAVATAYIKISPNVYFLCRCDGGVWLAPHQPAPLVSALRLPKPEKLI